uniref:Uncharacterized protein n=1 Tax=Arundo donax TaxID=35708 RepID=A0A0A9B9A4_ARUDO
MFEILDNREAYETVWRKEGNLR